MAEITIPQMLEMFGRKYADVQDYTPPKGLSPREALRSAAKASAEASAKKATQVEELQEAMPQILELIDEIEEETRKDPNLWAIQIEEDGPTWRKVFDGLNGGIDKFLASDDKEVQRAVALPTLQHLFKRRAETQQDAEAVLKEAEDNDLVIRLDTGGHRFSDQFGLTPKDMVGLGVTLATLTKKAGRQRQVRTAEVPSVTNGKPEPSERPAPTHITGRDLTLGEAFRGSLGSFSIPIPANGDGRGGGDLKMEAVQDDQGIHLVAHEAPNGLLYGASLPVDIPLSAIKDETGEIRDHLMLVRPPCLSPASENKWSAKTRLGEIFQEKFREALEGKKDMPPAEFLPNNGPVGDTVIDFPDFAWEHHWDEDAWQHFEELSLRFQRRDDGKIGLAEILTPEAEELFGDFLGKFYEPGMNFDNMPQPLKNFLKASYGMFV